MKYFSWFLSSTSGIRLNIFVRIIAGLLQAAIGLQVVWLSKKFIDIVIVEGSDDDIFRTACRLFGGITAAVLLRQLYYYMTVKAGTVQSNCIRKNIFGKLFSTPLYNNQTLHSGDVASRLAKDIELVSEVSTDILPQITIIGAELIGAFLLMRYFDARLAWLLVLITPVTAALGKFISFKLRALTHGIRAEESKIQMQVQESIEQNAVLRSLCCQNFMTKTLDTLQNGLRALVLKRTRFMVIIRVLIGLTFSLGYMTAFVWGGLQLKSGAITFGTMTSFLQLVGLIQSPILTLLNYFPKVVQATASIDRLEQMNVSSDEVSETKDLKNSPLGIEFKNVSFKYSDNGGLVLNKFSHNFTPKSKTAITGRTGIGKTTLFRLMLSFIRPESGEIMVYNDEENLPVNENLRNNFVFVPQGNTLISGTLRYNLQLADPEADDEKLKKVLHTACADFVFSMPNCLDTKLSEHGGGLSEGQAQRIAIARGLLRPGKIFLLDEITSALDEETEKELYKRLFKEYPDKTMIFITHRPSVSDMCEFKIHLE
ncbi:MAG: ABC transporter ATP-binding protein [Bacteroidales bacterium]|nr:ABC transporter ATP-binding protein [Bacteroidales bacterium]